ncbi:MAG: hypothetical protein ACK526_14005 [Planctomyces sp.]
MAETWQQSYNRIHGQSGTQSPGRQHSGGNLPQTFFEAVEFEIAKAMNSGQTISRSDAAIRANKTFPALRQRLIAAANR